MTNIKVVIKEVVTYLTPYALLLNDGFNSPWSFVWILASMIGQQSSWQYSLYTLIADVCVRNQHSILHFWMYVVQLTYEWDRRSTTYWESNLHMPPRIAPSSSIPWTMSLSTKRPLQPTWQNPSYQRTVTKSSLSSPWAPRNNRTPPSNRRQIRYKKSYIWPQRNNSTPLERSFPSTLLCQMMKQLYTRASIKKCDPDRKRF